MYLVDPVPLHVERASAASASRPGAALAGAQVGDARRLPFDDGVADAVLMLGPLYHLTTREDRVLALREARRGVRPGGVVAAAAISRFASTYDGLFRGLLEDPESEEIVERDVAEGQHRNPADRPGLLKNADFKLPRELRDDEADAKL